MLAPIQLLPPFLLFLFLFSFSNTGKWKTLKMNSKNLFSTSSKSSAHGLCSGRDQHAATSAAKDVLCITCGFVFGDKARQALRAHHIPPGGCYTLKARNYAAAVLRQLINSI